MSNNKLIQQGWECPKCGCVYSPLTSKCNVCPQSVITSGTSSATFTLNCFQYTEDEKHPNHCERCGQSKFTHPFLSNTLHNL